MSLIHRVSPLGRYAFGSIIDTTTNLNEKAEWLLWLELSVEDSEPLFAILEEEVKLGVEEFGKTFATDKIHRPYRQATMPDPDGGSERIENPEAFIWVFKRKATYFDSKARKEVTKAPPQIVDSEGIPVKMDERPVVGYGSTVKALFQADHYSFKGQKGIAFRLNGVQIGTLKTNGGEIGKDLAPIEGGWKQHNSDVDLSVLVGAAD